MSIATKTKSELGSFRHSAKGSNLFIFKQNILPMSYWKWIYINFSAKTNTWLAWSDSVTYNWPRRFQLNGESNIFQDNKGIHWDHLQEGWGPFSSQPDVSSSMVLWERSGKGSSSFLQIHHSHPVFLPVSPPSLCILTSTYSPSSVSRSSWVRGRKSNSFDG